MINVIIVILFVIAIIHFHSRLNAIEKQVKEALAKTKTNVPTTGATKPAPPPVPNELMAYVRSQAAAGMPLDTIKSTLVTNGWQLADIERALAALSTVGSSSVSKREGTEVLDSGNTFFEWLKEDWLMKLGALLLLMAAGWLVSYAFLHNWIGPMGRIMLGVVLGALLIVLGWWRIQRYVHQGGIFLVLGSTTILLTLFAARTLYNFFTPETTLAVMFLSIVFVAAASVVYKRRPLALASLVLAGVAPFMVHSSKSDYFLLFSYLLVVVLATIWVVVMTKMKDLTPAALVLVVLYILPHFALTGGIDRDTLMVFIYIFAGIFFVTNTASILKSEGGSVKADLVCATGNALFLLVCIISFVPEVWQSLVIAGSMVFFSVGAFLIYQVTSRREPFYVYAAIGIAMLGAATAAELKGEALIIAFTLEIAAIVVVTQVLLRDTRVAGRLSVFFFLPIILSAQSIASSSWRTGVIHEDFFVLFVLMVTLFALGGYLASQKARETRPTEEAVDPALLVGGSIYAYILLWLSLHAGLHNDDLAVMIALVIYTLIGITTYFMGRARGSKGLVTYGGVLLGLVVARLLFVDVWKMELTGRIITFFLIGALLIGTAFLGKRSEPRIIEEKTKDHA